jgi:MFS family permease
MDSAAPIISEPLVTDSTLQHAARRAVFAAFIGFFVDMFDVYLPTVAMGPAMNYFQPDTLSTAAKSTLFYIVFALSLVGRPIGAAIFGHFADKIGRRRVAIISMGGFTLVTLLIGLLPGYETLGIASIAILTSLRFIDGLFLGGEYTCANPLAMEYAPKEKRGMWAAFIHTGFPIAIIVMSLITTSMLHLFPAGSPHSPYSRIGWRVPFFFGALLSGTAFLFYLRRVPESRVWANAERTKSPLRELCRGDNLRCLLQVFVFMSGAWFLLNAVASILPGVLLTIRNVSGITVTNAQLAAAVALGLAFVPTGILGQKFGRRRILALFGLASCTVGTILYFLLVNSAYRNTIELIALVAIINLSAVPMWAIVTSYLSERFPTAVRASGYGIGYSAAAIIPAFSSFYMLALAKIGIPYAYTELVILFLGGLLLSIGVLSGPETRHVNL